MHLFKSKDRLFQLTLNLDPSSKFSIDQGITKTNENTLEALRRFNMLEKHTYKTFYLWGRKGSGKTFWLRSWDVQNKKCSSYIDTTKFFKAVPKKNNCFFYIDNIEHAVEETRNSLFEELICQHLTKNKFVLASKFNLHDLKNFNFRDDLISRLKQGLVYHLEELPDEEKKNALRVHIFNLGWTSHSSSSAYDNLINYMLTHLPRELGALRLILDKINEDAVKQKKSVSLQLIKEFIEENGTY